MTLILCIDWRYPHILVIGWGGLSLTPILVSLHKAEPNTIYLLPVILFLYYLTSFQFLIKAWWRDLTIGNNTLSVLVLVIRLFGAFTLYHGGHFILFKMQTLYPI